MEFANRVVTQDFSNNLLLVKNAQLNVPNALMKLYAKNATKTTFYLKTNVMIIVQLNTFLIMESAQNAQIIAHNVLIKIPAISARMGSSTIRIYAIKNALLIQELALLKTLPAKK